jgi:hypothetical protein
MSLPRPQGALVPSPAGGWASEGSFQMQASSAEDVSRGASQTNALMPVMLRPTIKVFISRVPS